jgi:addiction module HigA family antidote
MIPVHPGRILKDELNARGLSANRLALALRLPSGRIVKILNGRRGVTPDTALRLGQYFGTGARIWINLQAQYDLADAEKEFGARLSPRRSRRRVKAGASAHYCLRLPVLERWRQSQVCYADGSTTRILPKYSL